MAANLLENTVKTMSKFISIKDNPIVNFFSSQTPVINDNEFMKKTEKGHTFKLKGNRSFKFNAGIDDLEKAIQVALDAENPSRIPLYNIIKNNTDLHVKSQIRTALFKVIQEEGVIVDSNYVIQKDATEQFKRKWFDDLNNHILEAELYGHSLIYFFLDLEKREIESSELLDRFHVSPERGAIIPDLNNEDKVFVYRGNELFQQIFLEVGKPKELGLMHEVVRQSILKRYTVSDWARSSEKFGDPLLAIKSASDNEEENDAKESFAKNFGNNGYVIVDVDDEIELMERKGAGSAHKIYLDFIKYLNEENSKGINGQSATADEKAFVGSAEVHERILNDYTLYRLRKLMHFHNEKTIPFLVQYNDGNTVYTNLKGMKWMPKRFLEKDKKDEDKKPTDPNNPPVPDPKNVANPFI